MGIINTSIRIDEDVKNYAKIAARRSGYTFMAYYEDLILKDIQANHIDLFDQYKEGKDVEDISKPVKKRSLLALIKDPNVNVVDSGGAQVTIDSDIDKEEF